MARLPAGEFLGKWSMHLSIWGGRSDCQVRKEDSQTEPVSAKHEAQNSLAFSLRSKTGFVPGGGQVQGGEAGAVGWAPLRAALERSAQGLDFIGKRGSWWQGLEVGGQCQMGFSAVPLETVGRMGWCRTLFSSLEGHETVVDFFWNYRPFVELSRGWSTCEVHTSE